MDSLNGPRRTVPRIVGWTVAGVLAVAAASAVGVAFAGSSGSAGSGQAAGEGVFAATTDSPSASPSSPGAPDHRKPGWPGRGGWFPRGHFGAGMGRDLLHGEFVVKDQNGKTTTMVEQHGTVTAVSASSVSLKSSDGFTGTYAVNNDTKVRVGGGPAAISGVKTGNEAWVVATKGGTSTATILVVRD